MIESPKGCIGLENNQGNNSDILKKIEKVRILILKSWEPCSFGWEMVGDGDLKSWEMVGNLLISEVWEPCMKGMGESDSLGVCV